MGGITPGEDFIAQVKHKILHHLDLLLSDEVVHEEFKSYFTPDTPEDAAIFTFTHPYTQKQLQFSWVQNHARLLDDNEDPATLQEFERALAVAHKKHDHWKNPFATTVKHFVDFYEDPTTFIVMVEIPAESTEDEIELEGSPAELLISCGSFQQRVPIPASVDQETATTTFEDNVLEIRFQKRPNSAPMKLTVPTKPSRVSYVKSAYEYTKRFLRYITKLK